MTDRDDHGGGIWRWLGLALSGIGLVMMAGVVVGFSSKALEADRAITARDVAILAAMLALTAAFAFAAFRLGRQLMGAAAGAPRRERLSRNILLACGALGGVIGLALAATADLGNGVPTLDMFARSPIAPGLAIGLAAVLLILLPAVSLLWHRVIDEHEQEAYRDGAVAAAYCFMTFAPAWWFLWRGGLLPEPDGVIIFMAFNTVFLAVWFWKKYR